MNETNGHGAEQPFATEMLRGDVRDDVLREFKAMEKPWQQMSEDEQGRVIQRAGDIADKLVCQAVDLVASRGLPALAITVGKFTCDGALVKGTFETRADDDDLLKIRHLADRRAMFVLADASEFKGQRSAAEPENVGDLAIPKTGAGAPSDAEGLAKVGRGKKPEQPAA